MVYDHMSVSDRSTTMDMVLFPFGVALSSPCISYYSQLKEIVYHINLIDCIPFIDFFIKFSVLFRRLLSKLYP